MSSADIPVAVIYAPSIALNVPPLSLVSKILGSLIATEPSLSAGRKIKVSPAFVCMYSPISTVDVEPSPIKVGICALGLTTTDESQFSS